MQEKHRYSNRSNPNLADLPCWGFQTELLWQSDPWLRLRHLCAPKCWMAASHLMTSQPNSSWNGRSLMSWTTTETLNTIFPHRTALSALSLTQWLSPQHSSQLILMSWPKSHFLTPWVQGSRIGSNRTIVTCFCCSLNILSFLQLLLLLHFEILLFCSFLPPNLLASHTASRKLKWGILFHPHLLTVFL